MAPPVVPSDQLDRLPPFTGLEVVDGWYVIGAAALLLVSAFMIVLKKTSLYAWMAFIASMTIGGIAISDYRGIEELHLDMEGIGRAPTQGMGLTLVAVAGLIALIASVAAVAASPRETA